MKKDGSSYYASHLWGDSIQSGDEILKNGRSDLMKKKVTQSVDYNRNQSYRKMNQG